MRAAETLRYKVAVVRVEVRDQTIRDLLIELVEVGRQPESDRLLGSTSSISEACRILAAWLGGLTQSTVGDRRPTIGTS
jgi:hypothetical protein